MISCRHTTQTSKNVANTTFKPFLSDKVRVTNKMALIDKEEIIIGDCNTAKVLNTFFSNTVSNLNIAECSNCKPFANNIKDPVLKCVVKYRNHWKLLKHAKILISRQKLSKRMRIYFLTSFLQVLMILSKNLIFHPP